MKNGDAQSDIIPELQIIDLETYERAQELMKARTQPRHDVPLNLAGRSLLVGNIYCGHCKNRLTHCQAVLVYSVSSIICKKAFRS